MEKQMLQKLFKIILNILIICVYANILNPNQSLDSKCY